MLITDWPGEGMSKSEEGAEEAGVDGAFEGKHLSVGLRKWRKASSKNIPPTSHILLHWLRAFYGAHNTGFGSCRGSRQRRSRRMGTGSGKKRFVCGLWGPPLMSKGAHNIVPWTGWLGTMDTHCHTILEARNPKPRCQQSHTPPEGSSEESFLASFHFLLVCWQSSACLGFQMHNPNLCPPSSLLLPASLSFQMTLFFIKTLALVWPNMTSF